MDKPFLAICKELSQSWDLGSEMLVQRVCRPCGKISRTHFGLFGMLALVLAAVGLYGVTAYTVERRTSEIGVRMALGADRDNIVRLVLRGAFSQVLIGLIIGVPISIVCGHLIASQLYLVKSWDPLVLSGSIAALGFCALLASVIPARRAASINPVQASRTE
jgi:ABC-type antimicrobial peptide transport system permease subunit